MSLKLFVSAVLKFSINIAVVKRTSCQYIDLFLLIKTYINYFAHMSAIVYDILINALKLSEFSLVTFHSKFCTL